MRTVAFLVLLSMLSISMPAQAVVPSLINYQGTLADDGGVALDTTVAMTFAIYYDSTGAASLWTETQPTVTVTSGVFDVLLGSVNPLSEGLFGGTPWRWLGVQVGGDPELTPRHRLVTVPHAFHAAEAETAAYARSAPAAADGDWIIAGSDMYSAVSGDVGIGTMTPAAKLDVRGTLTTGEDGSGYDVNFYGVGSGSRFFWNQDKMALRAGIDTDGTHWAERIA